MRRTGRTVSAGLGAASCFAVATAIATAVACAPATFAQVPAGDSDAPVVFRATTELIQFDALASGPRGGR